MYDIIRLFAIPAASTLCAAWLWAHGTDPLSAAGMGGAATFVAQMTVRMLHDARADSHAHPRGRAAGASAKPRPTYEDITLDDLNALLERIDRGEDGAPDPPPLTTNERRERLAMMASDCEMEMAEQRLLELRRTNSYTTFYADDVAYVVIPNTYGTVERR